MRLSVLRAFALSLPHTTCVKQWGENLVCKVAAKMFLIISLDGTIAESVIFKCAPDEFDGLTEHDGVRQAPYCAKRHWVQVEDLGVFPIGDLERLIRHSYDLVIAKMPKKLQAALK